MARPRTRPCAVCGSKAHPDGIRHLPSKRYQARLLGPDGRRYTKTFETTKDARAWLHQMHADISAGKFTGTQVAATTAVTFGSFSARWLETRKVRGRPLADRTRAGYRDLLDRLLLPTFGTVPVHRITREDVEDWYKQTGIERPTYRAKAYGLLRTVLASAVDEGYLSANPARIPGAGQPSASTSHGPPPSMSWRSSPRRCRLDTGCSSRSPRGARCGSAS